MTNKSNIISVTGHISLDYLFNVNNIAYPNKSSPIKDIKMYYGGGAANVSMALSKLNQKVKLISPVGSDFYTSGYYDLLVKNNIILDNIYIYKEEKLSKAFVFTDDNNNQTTYFYWGVGKHMDELDPPKQNFVHISTASSCFNQKVSINSNFVSFDPGQDLITYKKEELETILKNTDILFSNRYEINLICKILDRKFNYIKKVIDTIVITKDKDGSVLYSNNKKYSIKPYLTNNIDPTGAGDAYKAGFLYGYNQGQDLQICCNIGSILSSFVIESYGCQTNLPTLENIKERYFKLFKYC